jgi:hypothetical protein
MEERLVRPIYQGDLAQKLSPVLDIVSHPRLNIMYDVTGESVMNK